MGNSDSKKKKKKDENDDGCIGNRRVRTIILASIIFAFFVFALAYLADSEESARDAADLIDSDTLTSFASSWAFIITGAAISMIGCVCAVVLFFIPGCDDKLGRVAGLVLIVGGVVYLIGWIWNIAARRDTYDLLGWEFYSDEAKEQINAGFAAMFGEALLAGGSAILLGVDALFQIYDKESFRLASNLGVILVVSAMCAPTYYLQVCSEDDVAAFLCVESDGVEAIATGYLVLFWACVVYIALYIFTCCTCNCKDNCLVRVALAVALVIGGVLAAIGYYVKSGGIEDADADGDAAGKAVAYWIGYTILICGLCIVWALDIALDDVKNNAKK